jgi:hypothetical protein
LFVVEDAARGNFVVDPLENNFVDVVHANYSSLSAPPFVHRTPSGFQRIGDGLIYPRSDGFFRENPSAHQRG